MKSFILYAAFVLAIGSPSLGSDSSCDRLVQGDYEVAQLPANCPDGKIDWVSPAGVLELAFDNTGPFEVCIEPAFSESTIYGLYDITDEEMRLDIPTKGNPVCVSTTGTSIVLSVEAADTSELFDAFRYRVEVQK